MAYLFLIVLLNICSIFMIGCSSKIKESVLKSGTTDSDFVQLTKINNNVWVHTTYYDYNGFRTESNGLLILTARGLVLYDKPNPSIVNDDTILEFGETKVEVYFPREGHTVDNIVVWLPNDKILFGGCILKSIDSKTIGNTADANIEQWPNSIENLINKFPSPTVIIPGHGKWGDKEIYTHTLSLLKK